MFSYEDNTRVSLQTTVMDALDDVKDNEFIATISVCEALYENYSKAFELMEYNHDIGLNKFDVFTESFVMEADQESWWRKNNAQGKREHILISILLLPLRAIQAFIKWLRKCRTKQESEDIDKKLRALDRGIQNSSDQIDNTSDYGVNDAPLNLPGNNINHVTRKGDVKKVRNESQGGQTEVELKANPSLVVSTEADMKNMEEVVSKASEEVRKQTDYYQGILSEENLIKIIQDGLNNGALDPVQAKQVMAIAYWRPGMKHNYSASEFIREKNTLVKSIDETTALMERYQKAIERIMSIIRDHPSENRDIDNKTISELSKYFRESQNVVVVLSEQYMYMEKVIQLLNDAADEMLRAKGISTSSKMRKE